MQLYNTLTKQQNDITPYQDDTFRMYVCGITPYDATHLGHAFTYVSFDTLERYLRYRGYDTIMVQNVTDIDDDILKAAKKRDTTWQELAKTVTQQFLNDLHAMNVRHPDHFPYASETVDKIIEMSASLLEKGHAYEREGSVYFDVSGDERFGQLVDWDYDKMLEIANERGNHPDDPNKDDPLDFVLWQAAQPGEPSWESPWGQGRPGWHIECSAMSMRYLGDVVDIHGGGSDLIFPHHECEIAQSEYHTGERPFVRNWFHIAMVELDGEKMSKSLGNLIFVKNLREEHDPLAIRLALLGHHYREAWSADEFDTELAEAAARRERWAQALAIEGGDAPLGTAQFQAAFNEAMDDDLRTGRAIAQLDLLADAIIEGAAAGQNVAEAQKLLSTCAGDVLGVL